MIRNFYNYNGSDDIFQSLEREKIFGLGGSSGDSLLLQLIKKTLTEIKVSDLDGLTKISDHVFSGLTFSSVTLPDSITSIGNNAFEGCTIEGDVVLPDSITSIGDSILSSTTINGNVILPNNMTNIPKYMFLSSKITGDITMPVGVTSIEDSAFNGCNAFDNKDITWSINLTSIGKSAFAAVKCNKFILGSGIRSVGDYAFSRGTFNDVYYDGDLESWFNINFGGSYANPIGYSNNFYLKNSSGEYELLEGELVIPESITEVPPAVLSGCKCITDIIIHDRVTSIGDYAFANIKVTSITIPDSVTSIGRYAVDSYYITNVVVGRGVTSIGDGGLRCGQRFNNGKATLVFLSTTPPTITSSTLGNISSGSINKIVVPKGCGEAYKTATNWANYADLIEEATE